MSYCIKRKKLKYKIVYILWASLQLCIFIKYKQINTRVNILFKKYKFLLFWVSDYLKLILVKDSPLSGNFL